MKTVTRKERLTRQTLLQEIDAIPSIGGWMLSTRNLAAMAGLTEEAYLANHEQGFVKANRALGVDGIVSSPIMPDKPDIVRTGSLTEAHFADRAPEEVLRDAEKLPDDPNELLKDFNAEAVRHEFIDRFRWLRELCGDMEPIPNFWEFGGGFSLYFTYGYVAFLEACALYPEAVEKIWRSQNIVRRERAAVLAALYKELDLVPLLFCGDDICDNNGPMVSPAMLHQRYFPHVKAVAEPFVEAGIRMIYHCDGDVKPLLQDCLDAGYSGFQGFQYECDIDVAALRKLTPTLGEKPLFFGGLSVSRTLPFGTPDDVRREVDYLVDATDGGRGLFLFTSNVTGLEVPAENIAAGYRHVKTRAPGALSSPPVTRWPSVAPRL